MNLQHTLAIIKPDAFPKRQEIEAIIREHFSIESSAEVRLTKTQVEHLYREHAEKPFYKDMCDFMMSGHVVVMKLSGPDTINKFRELIGATDPKNAAEGTIRKQFGTSLDANAIHGSDSEVSARRELEIFESVWSK